MTRAPHTPSPPTTPDPLTALVRDAVRVEIAPLLALLAERADSAAAPTPGFVLQTITEAAERARCSASTLRRAIACGLLRATKLAHGGSSRVLIEAAELDRWLKGARRG